MSKLMTMAEAIAYFVPDSAVVALGLAFETMVPFAAGHELIRQQRQHLTLLGPISDILFDQLIGAGCADKITAAWVGNNNEGIANCYRRAAEQAIPQEITIEEHSSYTIALGLFAGSAGVPYIPARTALGGDLPHYNPTLRVDASALDGTPVLLIPALRPDVAIIHVQRSDVDGNAHLWGNTGVCEEGMLASEKVILIAEEIVGHEVIASDPNRVLGPSFKVCAVVHEPWGAHPSPVQGYYNRDHASFHSYFEQSQTAEGFQRWLDEWVLKTPTRAAYIRQIAEQRKQDLLVKEHHYSAPVDYGY